MGEKTNNSAEEVDLGKLFQLIGHGFKNLFYTIGEFFKAVFHYVILVLIFLKKNAIFIGIATVIGGGIGYFLQVKRGENYHSEMVLSTNFGSGNQLYSQVNLLNNLISNKDYKRISSIFNIDVKKAATITEFAVEPYKEKTNLLKEFDYYIQHTDTIYTKDLTIDKFKNRYSEPDYKYQLVTVFGKDKTIFPLLNNNFNKSIETNELKGRLLLKIEELDFRKKIYKKDLKVIDSLRAVYKKIDVLNANKNSTSRTSINLVENQNTKIKDIELFKETTTILSKIKSVNTEKIRNGYIVKNITQFNIGESPKKILSKLWLKFALIGFLLSVLAILGLQLNKYLDSYLVK